jgi:hypothetical protein
MQRHVIIRLKNGQEVYVNMIASAAGRYLGRRPYMINLIKEVLQPMNITGSTLSIERDMGRNIGATDIVETTEKDIIFYAQPHKTAAFARYAKNRYPAPSTKLALCLERDDAGDYALVDTWIGPCSPPFPGDEKATAQSKPYWQTHALAQDAHAVQSKTITKDCPY